MSDSRPSSSRFDAQAAVAAVADGEPVDWESALRAAEGDDEREQIAALRAIERIRLAFSTWHTEGGREGDTLDAALEAGDCWGDLEILDRVGRGSFGDVYRARDPHLDRLVALKLLRRVPRENAADDEATWVGREQRAVREGQLLARVRHENVVTVYGAARHDGRVGLWMEYLEGKTLADLLREQGPSSAREAAGVGIDICRALAAVHAEGILHRDVKAQNVMRAARGRIVLTDFGIGRELGAAASGEEAPSISGTPLYLAPEVLAGGDASVASDLYAVGVLLFYLTTGDFPVRGGSLRELREAHERGETRLLRDVRPDLPRGFVEAVERALAADPKDRPKSAGALERALAAWAGTAEQMASETSLPAVVAPRRAPRKLSRPLIVWGLGAVAVVAVALLAALFVSPSWQAQRSYRRALAEQKKGDTESALRALDRAIEIDPSSARAWASKAEFLSGTGRYAEALQAEDRAYNLLDRFRSAERHAFLGSYAVNRMRYEDAVEEYAKAVDLDPDDDASWRNLALAHANLGQYAKALGVAEKAAVLDPRSVVSAGLVSIFLASLGGSEEALVALRKARERLGDDEYFTWGEGLARAERGEYEAAERQFLRLSQSTDSGRATFGRLLVAQVRILKNELPKAREILEESAGADLRNKNDRNRSVTSLQLGGLALLDGDETTAQRIAQQLEVNLADVPLNLKPLRDTALLALDAGDPIAAQRLLVRLTNLEKLYPSHLAKAFVAQVRGELALERGDGQFARELMEEAHQLRPDLSIRYSLAKAWIAAGRCDRAVERLDEIVDAKGRAVREYQAMLWVGAEGLREKCRASRER